MIPQMFLQPCLASGLNEHNHAKGQYTLFEPAWLCPGQTIEQTTVQHHPASGHSAKLLHHCVCIFGAHLPAVAARWLLAPCPHHFGHTASHFTGSEGKHSHWQQVLQCCSDNAQCSSALCTYLQPFCKAARLTLSMHMVWIYVHAVST